MGGGQSLGQQQRTEPLPYFPADSGGNYPGGSDIYSMAYPPSQMPAQGYDFNLLMDDLYQRMKAQAGNDPSNIDLSSDYSQGDSF